MLIRELACGDLEQAAALERECFGGAAWSRESLQAAMENANALYLAAVEGEELTGCCGIWQSFEDGEIMNVAVKRTARRRGCARALLQELLIRAGARGIRNFTLEVRQGNLPAIRLYESLGFETAGVRKNFYEGPRENALIMWKSQDT